APAGCLPEQHPPPQRRHPTNVGLRYHVGESESPASPPAKPQPTERAYPFLHSWRVSIALICKVAPISQRILCGIRHGNVAEVLLLYVHPPRVATKIAWSAG